MKRLFWNITILVATFGAPLAHADIMYSFAGQNFTYVNSSYPAIWTTSDSISGYFTLASSPGAQPLTSITPKSFSFKAGPTTITDATPLLSGSVFQISTAADGSILAWDIVLEVSVPGGFQVLETQDYGSGIHAVRGDTAGQCVVACFDSEGSVSGNDPAYWTVSSVTQPAAVPEPTSLALLSLVGLGTAIASRKRMASNTRN